MIPRFLDVFQYRLKTVIMVTSPLLDAVLYYTFHVIYLGYPADILARLWLAYDIAHPHHWRSMSSFDPPESVWKTFDDSIRESYKATGVVSGLISASVAILFSIDKYTEHTAIRTLLLAGLTCSVISAASCIALLSTVLPDPAAIEERWRISGMAYIISLAGPPAWLSMGLWMFQVALLVIVYSSESTSARALVTLILTLRIVLAVGVSLSFSGFSEFGRGLLGMKHGMSHHMVRIDEYSIRRRTDYRAQERVGNNIFSTRFTAPMFEIAPPNNV